MGFKDVLLRLFPVVYTEVEFVKRTYEGLKSYGFNDENTIASVCVCRDEISQSLRSPIKHIWGEAFNLSSLGGMFFAGRTGLKAAMYHAPNIGGRERYVIYALPHIAIDGEGNIGVCRREGREGESIACGALNAFQKEMANGKLALSLEGDDIEQSLLKMRLMREIPYGHVPDLLELTKIAQGAIRQDLELTLKHIVDTGKSDYAVLIGIQVHGPDGNYVSPSECYAVVKGKKVEMKL